MSSRFVKAAVLSALISLSLAAEAVVYTETVPGEDGPMVVEVVVEKGLFSSLRVLGPDEAKSLEGETVKETMNERVSPSDEKETLAVDPLSGALDPSDELIKAIREGIAAAKVNEKGQKVIFQAGTWHKSLDAADLDIEKEARVELKGNDGTVRAGYRVDPLSGSMDVTDDLQTAVEEALKRARKVKETR